MSPVCPWCHYSDQLVEGEDYATPQSRLWLCQRCDKMFRQDVDTKGPQPSPEPSR